MSEIASTGITEQEEAALIQRCQGGERRAFEPIVLRYMKRATAFALAWAGDQEDALDISQEVVARAFRAIRTFDPTRPFYPWFHTILRNLCLSHLVRASRLDRVPLERAELRRSVWEAIRKLGPQDREILILREFQDLTYAEIANVLDIPKGTVMSRLHTARLRLREKLEPLMTDRSVGDEL